MLGTSMCMNEYYWGPPILIAKHWTESSDPRVGINFLVFFFFTMTMGGQKGQK